MSSQNINLEGGCHCGAVRFRVRSWGKVLDCNCSICRMKGFLHLILTRDQFEILAGEDNLTTYTFNTGVAKHTFCKTCGVQPFYVPRSHPDGIDVNVRCLDDPPPYEVEPFDGRAWEANVETIR